MRQPRSVRFRARRLCSAALALCLLLSLCACRPAAAPEAPVIAFSLVPEVTKTPVPLPTPVPTPAFFLNESKAQIYGGGICQLVAYHNPGAKESETVRWTSSDESVAIVEEYGVVIGLSVGTAVITADANDGSGNTAACRITVSSDRPQPREQIRLRDLCYQKGKPLPDARADAITAYAEALDPARQGDSIARAALRYAGNYYGTKEGNIDCSMLLLYACLDNDLRLPRRSDWQARALEANAVSRDALEPGDMMFFAYHAEDECSCRTAPRCTRYLGVHHAAVYLGKVDGKHYVVEASSAIGRVVVRQWDGSGSHAGLKLVLCARP